MIRKIIQDSSAWKADLDVLLFFYRNRKHSSTGFATIEALIGWKPNQLVVQSSKPTVLLSFRRLKDLLDFTCMIADKFSKDAKVKLTLFRKKSGKKSFGVYAIVSFVFFFALFCSVPGSKSLR